METDREVPISANRSPGRGRRINGPRPWRRTRPGSRAALQEERMTAVAGEHIPLTRHRLAQRLRAAVLGPRGGGTTRRRASDAFRLGLAIVVVAVSIPVMRANSAAELAIVRALNPPPAAISWLVTLVFWLGSAGVSVLLIVVGLLVPRLTAVRRAA